MLRLKLRTKLLSSIIITTTLVFGSFLIFNNYQLEKLSEKQAIELADSYADNYASHCKNFMDIDMGVTMAIKNASQSFHYYSDDVRDKVFGRFFMELLVENPKYISVWNTIELQYTDSTYTLDHGRKSLTAVRYADRNEMVTTFKDMDGHNEGSVYYNIKQSKTPGVMEPYIDDDIGDFLITTIMAPIFYQDNFVGLGGIDFSLDIFQTFIDSLDLIEGSAAMVASNMGVVLGHTNPEYIGDTISSVLPELHRQHNLLKIIQEGNSTGFSHTVNDKPFYTSIVPFLIEGTTTPWAFSISIPIEPFLEAARAKSRNIIWIGIFGMAFIYIIIYLLASQIVKPLSKTTRVFRDLSTGNINNNLKLRIKTGDELEEMSESVNSLIDSLQKTEGFAQEIEKGNLEAEYEALSENDRLGNALLQMRQGLKDAKERESERRIEDQRRNWALDGLAKFADLLRSDSSNFEEYTQNLISNLANYTHSNQGGIYVLNNNDEKRKTIELAGSYAYDGEKFNKKVLEYGEGLIGVSIMEGKTTHLNELPENYLSISSGLGNNAPSSLVICPLKHNDEVVGALELASFTEYEDYQVKFIEDVAESIAVTIESLRIQQKSSLLLEQTQQQAEEMMAQEEELRQNMEEMMATQEENSRMVEDLQNELKEAKEKLKKKK